MMHHRLSRHQGHYAVNYNSDRNGILVQLMDDMGSQTRVVMNPDEVDRFIELLQKSKEVVNEDRQRQL